MRTIPLLLILLVGTVFLSSCITPQSKTAVAEGFSELRFSESQYYEKISNPISINGKLAFIVKNGNTSFVIYDGQKLGEEYDSVSGLTEIGGKPAFIATITIKNETLNCQGVSYERCVREFLVYDGQKFGKEYFSISSLQDIGGKPVFSAVDNIEFVTHFVPPRIIVYNGKEMGKEYNDAGIALNIGGKLAFVAKKDNKEFIIYDDKKLGKEYDYVSVIDFDGKPAYAGITRMKNSSGSVIGYQSSIVYNGQEITADYEDVSGLTVIGGKLAFIARTGDKKFVIYDGQRIGKEYYQISRLTDIGGVPVYAGGNWRNWDFYSRDFVVYNGTELGEYNLESDLIDLGGTLVFEASSLNALSNIKIFSLTPNQAHEFIVYNGQKVREEYDYIDYLQVIDGKLAFIAAENGKDFLVFDGKRVGKKYPRWSYLTEVGGKPVLSVAEGDNSIFHKLIVYEGQEIGKEYDSVHKIIDLNGKLVFIAKKDGKELVVKEN